MIACYDGPLRADLQQYFGIDLDKAIGGEHSANHIAQLVANLPQKARLVCLVNNDARWTLSDVLLAALVNKFNQFLWGISDPKKRGSAPEPIGPSYMTEKAKRSLPSRVLPISELLEELNKPRRRN